MPNAEGTTPQDTGLEAAGASHLEAVYQRLDTNHHSIDDLGARLLALLPVATAGASETSAAAMICPAMLAAWAFLGTLLLSKLAASSSALAVLLVGVALTSRWNLLLGRGEEDIADFCALSQSLVQAEEAGGPMEGGHEGTTGPGCQSGAAITGRREC